MGKLLVLAALVSGCAMYGEKPERIRNPEVARNRDKDKAKPVPVEPLVYIDACNFDFRRPAKNVKRDPKVAEARVQEGDASLATAQTAPDPDTRGAALVRSVDRYSDALRKDPFDAEATLKLARAYDQAQRKGCAIALLKRLSDLAANPRYAERAEASIDSVLDHDQWFRDYRNDAKSALGR